MTATEPLYQRLRWSSGYPCRAEHAGFCIDIYFNEDGFTEIYVSPPELGIVPWEGRCKSLDAAKRKAVRLVQSALRRMAKAWEATNA